MTAPRGTDTGSSDETAALPQPGPAAPSGEVRAQDPEPAREQRPPVPPAVPRAGAPRATPPTDGPGWAQSAAPGGARPGGEGASARTTVLPTGGSAAGRPAPPRPVRSPRPEGRPEGRPAAGARPLAGRTRRARLSLRRIDPWSVFLFSLVAAVFLGIALVVAVAVLYAVLGSLGVVDSVNQLFAEVTGGDVGDGDLLTGGRIVGGAAVLAAVNVVFLTLLATLASLLYNLCASFTGGLELTFGERD
jgi:hypothetical protein